ncbi:MAG: PQQ-binding-like beta-propeller repeat protein, partial [Maricaulaceae bacterium]
MIMHAWKSPDRAKVGAMLLAAGALWGCGPSETTNAETIEAEPAEVEVAASEPAPAAEPSADAAADAHPGQAVYQMYCATCHDTGVERAPLLSTLQTLSAQSLRFALSEGGVMAAQASLLNEEELDQVVDYLANRDDGGDWVADMMCPADRRMVDLSEPPSLAVFGGDLRSTRNLSAEQAGLSRDDMANLELAWAVGFPQTAGMGVTPAIVGSTLFTVAGNSGKVLAMDTESGCVKWAYDAGRSRSSMTYGEVAGQPAVLFSAGRGQVTALNAETGAVIWEASGQPQQGSGGSIRGAVVLADDKIIIPISASGVGSGANASFECCVGHGAVVALDAATGEHLWEYHTMEEADYTGEVSSTGVRQRGPSGAPIWATPTVDVERGLVYVATGENTSLPATETSDAIIALDLETGELEWLFQALEKDVWHIGCGGDLSAPNPNCPTGDDLNSRDFDFGGSPVIA